ncbi:MAG: M20/M25/M40 family metallo-hydrolase [Candidatus Aminicenantes bacterium]|nr:M20/M25/M40 family metallo-hydrolase [Candidatus Aminicenantes bacterium]
MILKKRLFVVMLLIGFCLTMQADKLENYLEPGLASIKPMDPYNYCKTMALPKYAGRLTGHEGYTAAAEWAAGMFCRWGLKPISQKSGYLLEYPSPYTIVDEAEMTFHLPKKSSGSEESATMDISLKLLDDFLPLLFSDSGEHTAGVVFAGWGICAPELGYDDYAGIDPAGKFVLCFRGTPDRREAGFVKHDHHRFRMNMAKSKGALGIIYIYDKPAANPNGDLVPQFTPAVISEKAADKLLAEKNITSVDLRKDLQTYKKPLSFPLNARITYRVVSRHFPEGRGYNIAGYVEGSDSKLKKECLVIGGHFDHCGAHCGLIFPGADDNASGSAVVMELAEAFSKLKKRPKRSVVFVLFGGEEMGLQGSTYFVHHLPSPFEKVDTMFNFDMEGEGDGTVCSHSPDVPGLPEVLKAADEHVGILRRTGQMRAVGVRGSDYAPFFQEGAICVAFFSNGPHLHYHLPGDTIYRINPDIMADIARLAFISSYHWANR